MAAIGRVIRSLITAPALKTTPAIKSAKLGAMRVRHYFLDSRTWAALQLRTHWQAQYIEEHEGASYHEAGIALDAALKEDPGLLGAEYEKIIIEQDA